MKSALLNLPNFRYVSSFEIDSQKLMDTVFPWRSILQRAARGVLQWHQTIDGFRDSKQVPHLKCGGFGPEKQERVGSLMDGIHMTLKIPWRDVSLRFLSDEIISRRKCRMSEVTKLKTASVR